MNEVFADTSGWANFFVRTEPFHTEAKNVMQQWFAEGTRVVTTNYVLIELVALMTSPLRIPRGQQINTIETIKGASWVEVVHLDSTLDEEAWALLKERQDKTWSLVDCASFVVMQHRGITRAFTTDHHFEQAGFLRILKRGL
jgi:predicted nucleic acid-binding protein